jgi:RHS repeat-associated protein
MWFRQFQYDQYGNQWTSGNGGIPVSGLMPTTNIFNAANRMNGISYDGAGNQTVMGADTLTYNAENQVTQVTETPAAGGGQVQYIYDADGRRVLKTFTNGPATVYVYDIFGRLSAEYSTGAPTSASCGTCYLSSDHLGSTRLVTDEGGNTIARHDYVPFGEEVPASMAGRHAEWGPLADNVNQKFTGKERDSETGLDFFGARYFSAVQGRFISPDWSEKPQPVPYADFADPQTLNLYSYIQNNPLVKNDPDGHCPWCIGAVIGFVGGGAESVISQKIQHPDRDFDWWKAGTAALGGAVAGGTLGMATAPATIVTILGGVTEFSTGLAIRVGAGASAGMLGGAISRQLDSGDLGTLENIGADAAGGVAAEIINARVVDPLVKTTTRAGKVATLNELRIAQRTRPSRSYISRKKELDFQQQLAEGAAPIGVDLISQSSSGANQRQSGDQSSKVCMGSNCGEVGK